MSWQKKSNEIICSRHYYVCWFLVLMRLFFRSSTPAKLCACLIAIFSLSLSLSLAWIWIHAHATLLSGYIQMHILLHFKYISWLPFYMKYVYVQNFATSKIFVLFVRTIITYSVNNILYLNKMLDASIVTKIEQGFVICCCCCWLFKFALKATL